MVFLYFSLSVVFLFASGYTYYCRVVFPETSLFEASIVFCIIFSNFISKISKQSIKLAKLMVYNFQFVFYFHDSEIFCFKYFVTFLFPSMSSLHILSVPYWSPVIVWGFVIFYVLIKFWTSHLMIGYWLAAYGLEEKIVATLFTMFL